MSIGSWWDKNVKQPINQLGKGVSDTVRKGTDAVGLTTPTIPDGAKPVIDQGTVADLAAYKGINRGNVSRWEGQTPGGPGYFKPQTYTPTMPGQVATPNAVKEPTMSYTPQTAAAPTEQSFNALALQRYGNAPTLTNEKTMGENYLSKEGQTPLGLGKVSGMVPNNSGYQTAAQQALTERMNTAAPTTEGYDPARKDMALKQMTAGLDTQQKDAEANLTEQLSKAGILNSSVGQAELAKLRQGYDQQRTNALTQVNLEDLAAARTDRYANADQASSRMSQISNLAGSGQGMNVQNTQVNAGLTAQDNQAIQAEAQNLMTQRGIDRDTAMQIATFNRTGNQTNNQNALSTEALNRQGIEANNNATLTEANYGRTGRQIDTQTAQNLAQTNFGNQMTTENFNRTGRQMGNTNDWNTYNAQVADANNRANLANSGQLYNLGSVDQAKQNENTSYQTDINNLARGSSGSIYTPESQAAADEYAARQALQSERFGNTLKLAGTLASGIPSGSGSTSKTPAKKGNKIMRQRSAQ